MPDRPRTATSRRIETALTAATGVALFTLLGLPLPFLFGPLAACLLAALAQRPLQGFGQVSKGFRTILGVAVGASLTPDVVAALPSMAASLAFIPLYILVIGLIGVPYFHRVHGF
ncbi:MAG: AbrB family transcriptional regulator, partial [Mameliella sp.]|nr:AbrB family transcriptional regulator [Mameliella sp.]